MTEVCQVGCLSLDLKHSIILFLHFLHGNARWCIYKVFLFCYGSLGCRRVINRVDLVLRSWFVGCVLFLLSPTYLVIYNEGFIHTSVSSIFTFHFLFNLLPCTGFVFCVFPPSLSFVCIINSSIFFLISSPLFSTLAKGSLASPGILFKDKLKCSDELFPSEPQQGN